MEHVTNCLNPQFVYNKYINKRVYVDCGKCPACLQRKQDRWIARMMQERRCWQFCYMLYLDYNDDNLPRYDFSDDDCNQLVEVCPRLSKDIPPINLYELEFEDENEREYFVSRLNEHRLGIPHCCVRDIQLFKKRLNTYIKREVTGTYKSYRSCIAAEYGPTTFRPHYHGVLFFNDRRIAEKINYLVRKAWSDDAGNAFGDAHADPEKSNVARYVAKYVTKPADIPKFYSHTSLRTFFLTSRNPPIGSLFESKTEVRQIFDSSSPIRVIFEKSENGFKPVVVPLEKRLKDRLFPKCPLYGEVPAYCRVELYKSVLDTSVYNFESYVFSIYRRTYDIDFGENFQSLHDIELAGRSNFPPLRSQFSQLIVKMTDNFNCLNSLKTLYSVGNRIRAQAEIFGISFDEYLSHIFTFYDKNFPLYQLRTFYRKQISLSPMGEDPRVFYPETEVFKGISPTDSKEYKLYLKDVMSRQFLDNRTKFKNAYFEGKLSKTDPVLYNLIKNYYAKKCNEDVEAFPDFR